jgi:hypothetical protein
MADFQDLIKQRESFSDESQTALMKKVAALQSGLWSELLEKVISELETNADGRILFNSANVQKVGRASVIWAAYRKKTGGVADWIVNRLLKLFGLNSAYAREVGKLSDTVETKARKLLLLSLGYSVDDGKIIQGSWLDNLTAQDELKQKIANRINSAIQSKASLKKFREDFRIDFLGAKGQGWVNRYFNARTQDLFFQFDRSTQSVYRDALKLDFALFTGTIMEPVKGGTSGTRPWCWQRVGNLYDLETINSWNEDSWDGKIKDVDVKIQCGGFSCRHSLNFISKELAETLQKRGRKLNALNPPKPKKQT